MRLFYIHVCFSHCYCWTFFSKFCIIIAITDRLFFHFHLFRDSWICWNKKKNQLKNISWIKRSKMYCFCYISCIFKHLLFFIAFVSSTKKFGKGITYYFKMWKKKAGHAYFFINFHLIYFNIQILKNVMHLFHFPLLYIYISGDKLVTCHAVWSK